MSKYIKKPGIPGKKRTQVNYTAAELKERKRLEAEFRNSEGFERQRIHHPLYGFRMD